MKYKTPKPAIIVGIADTNSSLFENDSVVDAKHTEESTVWHWLEATSAERDCDTNLASVPDGFEAGHERHTHGGFESAIRDVKR